MSKQIPRNGRCTDVYLRTPFPATKRQNPFTVLPLKVMENSTGFWGSGFLELETLGSF